MSYLERQASAGLQLEDALTLSEITEKVAQDDFSFLLPIEYGVMDLPRVDLTENQVTEIHLGVKLL